MIKFMNFFNEVGPFRPGLAQWAFSSPAHGSAFGFEFSKKNEDMRERESYHESETVMVAHELASVAPASSSSPR